MNDECVAGSSVAPASSVRQTVTTSAAAKIYHGSLTLSEVVENIDPPGNHNSTKDIKLLAVKVRVIMLQYLNPLLPAVQHGSLATRQGRQSPKCGRRTAPRHY